MKNEVQEEIIILNVMRYKNEKGEGCRLSFIFSDKPQSSKNFIGCAVVDQFYKDPNTFDKIKPDMLLQPVVATINITSDDNNPLRAKSIITRIESNENAIDLL